MLNAKIPAGPLEQKWTDYKGHCKLVNPANKRKLEVIIVGTGLAGASAAASLGELGYKVKAFCSRTLLVVHTLLLPREVSMLPKTIRMMVTVSFVFSTIPLKEAITAHAKPTYIVWPK